MKFASHGSQSVVQFSFAEGFPVLRTAFAVSMMFFSIHPPALEATDGNCWAQHDRKRIFLHVGGAFWHEYSAESPGVVMAWYESSRDNKGIVLTNLNQPGEPAGTHNWRISVFDISYKGATGDFEQRAGGYFEPRSLTDLWFGSSGNNYVVFRKIRIPEIPGQGRQPDLRLWQEFRNGSVNVVSTWNEQKRNDETALVILRNGNKEVRLNPLHATIQSDDQLSLDEFRGCWHSSNVSTDANALNWKLSFKKYKDPPANAVLIGHNVFQIHPTGDLGKQEVRCYVIRGLHKDRHYLGFAMAHRYLGGARGDEESSADTDYSKIDTGYLFVDRFEKGKIEVDVVPVTYFDFLVGTQTEWKPIVTQQDIDYHHLRCRDNTCLLRSLSFRDLQIGFGVRHAWKNGELERFLIAPREFSQGRVPTKLLPVQGQPTEHLIFVKSEQ